MHPKPAIIDGLVFLASLALMAALHRSPVILAAALLLCWIAILIPLREKGDIAVFLVSLVVGFCFEVLFVWVGTWTYPHPTLLGVPLWIPVMWGILAVLSKRFVIRTFRDNH